MKTRVCFIYFFHGCHWKKFFASDLPQSPLNLRTILVTTRTLTQFQFKIRATKLRKSANFRFT